jgi:hypothetical protein
VQNAVALQLLVIHNEAVRSGDRFMDIPLPRRESTWRDSPWWRATEQSLVSGVLIMILALPLLAFFAKQLTLLSLVQFDLAGILQDLAEGGLLMLPYLWFYFFALERIARQRPAEHASSSHQQ